MVEISFIFREELRVFKDQSRKAAHQRCLELRLVASYLVLCTAGTSIVVDPGNDDISPQESNSVLTLCKEVEDDI